MAFKWRRGILDLLGHWRRRGGGKMICAKNSLDNTFGLRKVVFRFWPGFHYFCNRIEGIRHSIASGLADKIFIIGINRLVCSIDSSQLNPILFRGSTITSLNLLTEPWIPHVGWLRILPKPIWLVAGLFCAFFRSVLLWSTSDRRKELFSSSKFSWRRQWWYL